MLRWTRRKLRFICASTFRFPGVSSGESLRDVRRDVIVLPLKTLDCVELSSYAPGRYERCVERGFGFGLGVFVVCTDPATLGTSPSPPHVAHKDPLEFVPLPPHCGQR
jgi:hypothetical protein